MNYEYFGKCYLNYLKPKKNNLAIFISDEIQ